MSISDIVILHVVGHVDCLNVSFYIPKILTNGGMLVSEFSM